MHRTETVVSRIASRQRPSAPMGRILAVGLALCTVGTARAVVGTTRAAVAPRQAVAVKTRATVATTRANVETARPHVLEPDLAHRMRRQPSLPQRVIVETAAHPSAMDLHLPGRFGGRITNVFDSISGYSAELLPVSIHQVANRPGVRRVVLDRPVRGHKRLTKNGFASGWDASARAVGADINWARPTSVTGAGVGVAILDTGIAPTPDIRVTGWVDFVNGRPNPYDDNGHGTHVAGIVAGNGAMSGGANSPFLGAAPGAHLIGVKVLNANATGYASTVIQGIDWCIANKRTHRIRIINLSLGQPVAEGYRTDPLCKAAERAVAAGLVVVVSAGNNGGGYGGIESPGNHPAVLTVGAMKTNASAVRSDDTVAGYSSRGPTVVDALAKPDILAPGNHVVSLRAPGSALDTLYPGNRVLPYLYGGATSEAPSYFVLSGTSMAAPVVSGIAAQILQHCPDLAPNAVKAALMVSAQPVGGYDPVRGMVVESYDWMTMGAGYANASGALTAAECLQASLDVAGGGGPKPAGWGADVIQGEPVAWGYNVLWGNKVADAWDFGRFGQTNWNRSVLWGDALMDLGRPAQVDAVYSTSALWATTPWSQPGGLHILLTGEPNAAG